MTTDTKSSGLVGVIVIRTGVGGAYAEQVLFSQVCFLQAHPFAGDEGGVGLKMRQDDARAALVGFGHFVHGLHDHRAGFLRAAFRQVLTWKSKWMKKKM